MGKVFACMSNVRGNGNKFITTELSYHIKEELLRKDKKQREIMKKTKKSPVLLIDLDLEVPYLCKNLTKEDNGLDTLIPLMTSNNMEDLVFSRNIEHLSIGVDILAGMNSPNQFGAITDEQVALLINKAKEMYDYVFVILSSKVNNIVTPRVLFMSDEVLLVMRNNTTNSFEIQHNLAMLEHYSPDVPVNIIYNFQEDNIATNINKVLSKSKLELRVVADFPFYQAAEDNKLISEKGKFLSRNVVFAKMKSLAKDVVRSGKGGKNHV